jgi:hypothetical protein
MEYVCAAHLIVVLVATVCALPIDVPIGKE